MMIGEVVRSRPGGRAAAVVFFTFAALFCVIAALSEEVGGAVFALLPLALGVVALASADKPVEFQIQEDGLEFTHPDEFFLRYEDMRGLTGRVMSGGKDFPIQVYHPDGVVRIPAGLNTESNRLYKFLLGRLPWRGTPDGGPVPAKLQDFVVEQVGLFGADKVYVFRGREFPPISTRRRHVWYSVGTAVAGLLWAAAGGVLAATGDKEAGVWVALGIPLVIFGGIFAAAFGKQNQGRADGWRDACLVVSPAGIALVQGKLRGKMRWAELLAIEYPAKPKFGTAASGAAGGLGLGVAGAYLIVADYYDRPLMQIEDCLREYWGGRHAN